MADKGSTTRECPYCREEIRSDALRCRHCQAAIVPERPEHGGTCPFCKESINPEAIRCKHCQADLYPASRLAIGCAGCGRDRARYATRSRPTMAPRRAIPRNARAAQRSDVLFDADPGCAETDVDEAGTWCFIESSEHYCIYELCEPTPYPIFR